MRRSRTYLIWPTLLIQHSGKLSQMNARPPGGGAAMKYLTPLAAVSDRRGGTMVVRAAGNRGWAGGEAPAVMVRCQRS
ncbi:hypothetical protein ACXR0O_27620 [Verrucomicrobiota bacterium sgz303538]